MPRQIRNIVVGIAAITEQDPHLAEAVALASELNATLHLVYAFPLPDPILYPYPEMAFFNPEAVEHLRSQALGHLETQLSALPDRGDVRCHAQPAPADLAILDVAGKVDADLVIVGATRRGAVARKILGTTAQRVVRGAAVPVLVSRGTAHRHARRILFATDLSETSTLVVGQGLEMASGLGGGQALELRCLLVVDYDLTLLPPVAPTELKGVAEMRLDRFLEESGLKSRGAEAAVRVGKPAAEIVADAEDWGAELLVLGTHGRTGASRLLIGSVAESVLRRASCDVLVVPPRAVAQ